jgi:PD-(D/E)XK endonuclease
MNVNQKGSIGLIEVIRDLTKKGYECFIPIHDYSPVDLIVMNEKFNTFKIQVKYRETYRGIIDVAFKSMVNGESKPIDLDAIDGWAVYCPEVDKVVYVGKHEIDLTKNGFAFRLTEGKNSVNINKVKRKIYTEFGSVDEWLKSAVC